MTQARGVGAIRNVRRTTQSAVPNALNDGVFSGVWFNATDQIDPAAWLLRRWDTLACEE